MFAARNEETALDIVQDSVRKLAEKYGDHPVDEPLILFRRIIWNTICTHYRRGKVRLFSAFSSGEEEDRDLLETREICMRDSCLTQTLAAVAFLPCAFHSTFWIADQRVQELGNLDSAILGRRTAARRIHLQGFCRMARQQIGGMILGLFLAVPGWTQTTRPSVIATLPQSTWSELAVPQKIILSPLADEWDSLEAFHQKKWLGIVAHFPSLTPEEQRRLQGQMQKWRHLSPEEQQVGRENYKSAQRLPADKRQELERTWEEYSSLPEEEKERLKKEGSDRSARLLLSIVPTAPVRARLSAVTPLPGWEPDHRRCGGSEISALCAVGRAARSASLVGRASP
jgi:hypothetical protein